MRRAEDPRASSSRARMLPVLVRVVMPGYPNRGCEDRMSPGGLGERDVRRHAAITGRRFREAQRAESRSPREQSGRTVLRSGPTSQPLIAGVGRVNATLASRAYREVVSRSPCVIEYQRTFAFAVGAQRCWTAMTRFDLFSSWWPWLREFSVEGNVLGAGTVLHGIVEPPLPYRMRIDVVVDFCEPARRVGVTVHGDLEGPALLSLEGDDHETLVHAAWTVEMMQTPMRLAARIGHPLLQRGHDHVVDATVDGFRRHLLDESVS